MRFYVSLLSIIIVILGGCEQSSDMAYEFSINNVSISQAYQALDIRVQQNLVLSQQAREALEHGVTLTIELEMELRNDMAAMVMRRSARYFELRYLPLIERYQLSDGESVELQSFSRLRHLLAAIADLNVHVTTGPLAAGNYELRTRIHLDESRLPTPMRLPAWVSPQWRHDSDWSVWPFIISA
jgi:hypothetical protein